MAEAIKSVAIVGAGASGAITAAALAAEGRFERVTVYERRGSAGGTWIYDAEPPENLPLHPGANPPQIDPPLAVPNVLPYITAPNQQERFASTPIYESLTTNVPSIAMSFSDIPFPYGPFVPHHVPKQYIEGYLSSHRLDSKDELCLNTTVEDLSLVETKTGGESWKLTLRKYDALRRVDVWWDEIYDAVVLANGHYSVPYIPYVSGLQTYMELFPGRVTHSKTYRKPSIFADKNILIIGNSASGHDLTNELLTTAKLPIYQSRRSPGRWDGSSPPPGIVWKPVISSFLPSGRVEFSDGSYLDEIDTVIYATGYLPSFPFWNSKFNGRELWSYEHNKLGKNYLHTFFHDFKRLAIIGIPRALSFRGWEYQAIAVSRLWAGRSEKGLPDIDEMEAWEKKRDRYVKEKGGKFHEVAWESESSDVLNGTLEWFEQLSSIAGLGKVTGEGRNPPRLDRRVRWALEHIRKYPVPDGDHDETKEAEKEAEWVVVDSANGNRKHENLLGFI